MRRLIDVLNINPGDANYPKGSMKDKASGILGTQLGVHLFGDIIQFFQKLVINSGLTENTLPDNVTNGYQLLDAAEKAIGSVFIGHINKDGTVAKKRGLGTFTFNKTSTGYYKITQISAQELSDYSILVTPIYDNDGGSIIINANIERVFFDANDYSAIRITNSSGNAVDSDFYINITKL